MDEHIAIVQGLRERAYSDLSAAQDPGEVEGCRTRMRALDAALGAMRACDDPEPGQLGQLGQTIMTDGRESQPVMQILRDALATGRQVPSPDERAALLRLLTIAEGDSGQCRRVASFLLAWWNAGSCGGFDLTDLWAVDTGIAADMVTVFGMIARIRSYPNSEPFAHAEDFARLVALWRPELIRGEEDPHE